MIRPLRSHKSQIAGLLVCQRGGHADVPAGKSRARVFFCAVGHRCPFPIGWLINRGVCLPKGHYCLVDLFFGMINESELANRS